MSKLFFYRGTIIVLLLINIAITVYFSMKRTNSVPQLEVNSQVSPQVKTRFPNGLGENAITKIFYSISEPYSTKEFDKLLTLLDKDVVTKFGKPNILNAFNKLYNIFGPISEGYFSSVFPITTTDKKLYKINYDVILSETSAVGEKAVLSVTVQLDKGDYKIEGIFLNTPSQAE